MNGNQLIKALASRRWMAFPLCLIGVLGVGIYSDTLLLPFAIGAILGTALYYGILCRPFQMGERFFIWFQPVFLTTTGSILFLFLEETGFKVLLLAGMSILHIFFLVHFRLAKKDASHDMRNGMLDSFRLFSHVTFFFLALIFYAPLFYFTIRHALFYGLPFLILSAIITWNISWVEERTRSQQILYTTFFTFILAEITLAQLWLSASYVVQALIAYDVFFMVYGFVILKDDEAVRGKRNMNSSLIFGLSVLLLLIVFSQWR